MAAGILILFTGSFPVGLRAASVILPETSAEIRNIRDSYLFTDLCHLHIGAAQKLPRLLHADHTDKTVQVHTSLFFENKAEITRGQVHLLRQSLKT